MKRYHAGLHAPFIVVGLILLGLVVGAGCHQAGLPTVRPNVWNERLVATLEAESETGGPFLALNSPDAGSAAQLKVGEVNGGPNSIVAAAQGNAPGAGTVFEVRGGLPSTYYLNLSIPVFGVIYVGSAGTQGAAPVDSMDVKVIVRHGGMIVGGESVAHNAVAANKQGKWLSIPINFRPEVAALEAGKPLTVEVIRVSGLTDFIIGTSGAQQSFIEFRYFGSNPLSGTVYLERGKFSSSGGEQLTDAEFNERLEAFRQSGGWDAAPEGYVHLPEPAKPQGASPLAFVAFGSLLGLGLVVPRRRLPVKPAMAIALVLALVFAGCMGGNGAKKEPGGGDDAQPTPTVNQTIEALPEGEQTADGNGAVEGVVYDEVGIAVRGAHVAFLGTNLFGKTDAKGRFAFGNVTAGIYMMRVDADKFAPLEQEITIEANSITRLNITLVYPVAKQQNDKAHVHDDWLGESVATFAEDAFTPPSQVYTSKQNLGSTWYCDGFWDRNATVKQRAGCENPLPIPMSGKKVFPGTSRVEVTLRWTTGGNAPKEMGLRIITTGNQSHVDQIFLPRAPGVPFNIAIFPNEADPGHQKFSSWQFFVVLPVTDGYHPAGPLYYSGGSISYAIKMHRGIVPHEPAHRDFWEGKSEVELTFLNPALTGVSGSCYPRRDAGWTLKGSFVPPGTKEIRGYISWKHAYLDASSAIPQTVWGVDYLPANGPRSEMPFGKAEMSNNGTNNRNFKIVPKAEETDQFYQFVSNWFFVPDDAGTPRVNGGNCYASTAYQTTWRLFAVAVKDPNYKDSS